MTDPGARLPVPAEANAADHLKVWKTITILGHVVHNDADGCSCRRGVPPEWT